ncbi:MAG TPA: carboxylesterase family protein [Acidobacteriaceae bacterium]|jgi:para-nitrobenzyl esterase|nr:carboxylesterase family protein [Acidobacteriaceae bacterium]
MLSRREFLHTSAMAFAGFQVAVTNAASSTDLVVSTPIGRIRGTAVNNAAIFRGVPFAQPPIGALRFRPPVPVKPWPGVRNATEFTPAAIQPTPTSFAQNEDCLYLNIWAPQGRGPFPVFVWIHGGGFTGGRASDPVFDGTVFTDHWIVCITVPYRLGVLGFLDMEPAPTLGRLTTACAI